MKLPIKALLLILFLLNPKVCLGQDSINLQLENQTQIIENRNYIVEGGLNLTGNASLTIINTTLTFKEGTHDTYSISGNSQLVIINSTLQLGNPWSVQTSNNASITMINSEVYETDQISTQTIYRTGIGASGNTRINIKNSKIGFIRLTDTTTCTITNSYIGEFGSQSLIDPQLRDCTIERVDLVYENSRIQINTTLTGHHTWFNQSQLVKSGQTPYDITLHNTTLLYPPNLSLSDGKLETHDTKLDMVQIAGDSAIETQNTKIYYLQLWDYSWAFIDNSIIDYLVAWNGDFNIRLTNTTHKGIGTYGTTGLNLKTNKTTSEQLSLDWAVPNTPQNIELYETQIGNLDLNMFSPTPIQCSQVTIDNLTLESGWGDEAPRTITGTIDWSEEATVNQKVKDGYTCIKRIYLIKATIDEAPASNTQLTIYHNNQKKTVTTNENGEAVLSLTYKRHYDVIQNPDPGGPYMINNDNLTKPVTIQLNQQNTTINILSDTPVIIKSTSQTSSQRWEPDWSQYTPAAVLVTLIAIVIYFINSRRLERANRQIQ